MKSTGTDRATGGSGAGVVSAVTSAGASGSGPGASAAGNVSGGFVLTARILHLFGPVLQP
ncbi:hypothetical protein ACZ91_22740 [Streptomyces regensis]|nr:hypothetical protein ACZ91_22740 [Streptomyces regensis]